MVQAPSRRHHPFALDPLGDFRAALAEGRLIWPTRTIGELLLQGDRARALAPSELGRLRDLVGARRKGTPERKRPALPRTFIQVIRDLDNWIAAAQALLADPVTWLQSGRMAVICANKAERKRIEALLRQSPPRPQAEEDEDVRWGDDSDLIAAAQDLAVRLYGADPAQLPRLVRTVDEIQEGQGWREVFLSPGCRELKRELLLRVLGTARVGLHVVEQQD